jgi:hypothetical protein
MTCRMEVLEAFFRLERKTGNREFRLRDVVDEVLGGTTEFKESTIRTHVTSVMCRDAPVNHLLVFDDLERIDRGIYRRKRL